MSLCCFDAAYEKLFLVRDVSDWWHELDFKRCLYVNVEGCRILV